MTIEKGRPWEQPLRDDDRSAPRFDDDADLAEAVARGIEVARVADGDLVRTLGLSGIERADEQRFPMDLGWVRLDDGEERPFVAHVVCRRFWWRGEAAVVMNAAWVGDLYLGPRAHPNDGLLDITFGSLDLNQRRLARSRARSGTHLPHPDLTTRRTDRWSHRFARPTPVLVDGVHVGSARSLEVRLVADAFAVVA